MLEGDSFQKFMFDDCHVRGELVRLDASFQAACKTKDYPQQLRAILAETTVASVLLTGTLKFEGRLAIHARGQGPVTLLMAEATNKKEYRCLANFDESVEVFENLPQMLGKAQLAITIDPEKGQRYQGIVPLEKDTVAECLADYFNYSEQLDTFFMFGSDDDGCFGLMLQKLPDYKTIEDQDAWARFVQLASTLTFSEVTQCDNANLLHRLFHEEKVSVYSPETVEFKCSCSKERSLASVKALGQDDALDILEHERAIAIDCQFCGQHYEFVREDINSLFGLGKTH